MYICCCCSAMLHCDDAPPVDWIDGLLCPDCVVECEECGGSGLIFDDDYGDTECDACEGYGYYPADEY